MSGIYKFLKVLVVIPLCFAAGASYAEGSAQEMLEAANLKKALYCLEVLEVELDVEKAGRECIGETYIQHAPHVPDGKQGFLDYFREVVKKNPELRIHIKRASADGDLVWIHANVKRTPDVLGTAIIHIFRMEGGKFVEHWGVGTPVREESVHGNSMF